MTIDDLQTALEGHSIERLQRWVDPTVLGGFDPNDVQLRHVPQSSGSDA